MQKKEEHFNRLVKENHQRIQSICKYYASVAEDQKDIYQEVLVNIWKSLDGFRGESQESTWIYRIALNTALGFAGKEFRRMKFILDPGDSGIQNILVEDNGDDLKLKDDQLAVLQVQINQLTVIERMIISLVLEGLSSKEISDVIGITEPNVRVKIHRIKESLREQMKGGDYGNQ